MLRALVPIWLCEIALTGIQQAFVSEELTRLDVLMMVFSSVVLPFFAGLRVVRAGGSVGLAALGGVSISGATFIVISISFLGYSQYFLALAGFMIATLMFSVVPQAICGTIGGIFAWKALYSSRIIF